jgi:hypothetical protein
MKDRGDCLQRWIHEGEFRFARLDLPDIDNGPVVRVYGSDILAEETCLFHRGAEGAADYLERLHDYVRIGMTERRSAPVVRFADGEYAFYNGTLGCNGLYRQAESAGAIREAMPMHIDALRSLAAGGKLAPLIFPGNIVHRRKKGLLPFFLRREEPSAIRFLDFLRKNGIRINDENYIPFYAVYAYLTSAAFARLVDGRKLVILTARFDPEAYRSWFARFRSRPEIVFVRIPAEYVATRWETIRDGILNGIPPDADLCLVGAGAGALPVSVDAARRHSIPALDAGHVLNMMNASVDNPCGVRLFTLRKPKMENERDDR